MVPVLPLHQRGGKGFARDGVADGVVTTGCEAIKAVDTTRAVHHMIVEIYAGSFAYILAAAALGAKVCVDVDMQQ